MKNKTLLLITVFVLLLTSSATFAKVKPAVVADAQTELRLQQIEARVNEIKQMDKSHLSSSERKELRKELVSMKKEAKAATGGGVYLSVGAIIIIILVLILIL
jgi:hypothetical protein